MVDIKTDWNEQNIKEYVRYTVFLRNKVSKTAVTALAVCSAVLFAFCITMFFIFGYIISLIFALMIVLITAIYVAFFAFATKNAAKHIQKTNAESELNRVMISEDDIIGFNDEEPLGTISWSKISDIYFDEKLQAAYLTSQRNAVLILECKNILYGTAEELKAIVEAKRNELSKKA